ncbi:hypothetical protein [Desulfosarcina ovata]|uniref:FlgO domain-containing protein n=2 Tax=Desulfosarcina ovata TaxID=83564 RepID=A0A5K8AEF4_9BACT|nr:hypothetical protein [Desulfosarcina ovata]BBO84433.1 hypothetical protein DSCO28_49990 [Desulfosarcina ovata subsp. sediminis]BBO90947.1 hypothetical protein DSCOOX_41270 [Desulfosarcina ovata subsp. ovata]
MNNKSQVSLHRTLLLFLTLPLMLLIGESAASAAPARVAILPFDIIAESDLSFLQEGVLDMLASRLSWQDNVEVINKNETRAVAASVTDFEGESRALLVGGKLYADYVLYGSLTVFDDSVSIDAKMVDISGLQRPLPFFAVTPSMGEVIPKINAFATDINAKVFGREVAGRTGDVQKQQTGEQQPYNPRIHPEKLLHQGVQ